MVLVEDFQTWLRPRVRLHHGRVALRTAIEVASARPRNLPGEYFIKSGYVHRPVPEYFDDTTRSGVVYQPEVYPRAASLAREAGAEVIVDVGCGEGEKLASLHPEFRIVGIDLGRNITSARERYPFGDWEEFDLDKEGTFPVDDIALSRAVVVCSDVIEHLRRPEHLLGHLRRCLDLCHGVVLSTPERNLRRGVHHMGPPGNVAHVREWAIDELAALLASFGFHGGTLELTRSNDASPRRETILAVLYPDLMVADTVS
jgi:2-polyprenyl-3-methyl-5-hydroxy-6-metoxy-1,4-benzoquinol methylase